MKQGFPTLFSIFIMLLFAGCGKDTPIMEEEMNPTETNYFPPIDGSAWETTSVSSLGWDEEKLEATHQFLESKGTRAFIIIKDGKIVTEKYWGKTIVSGEDFTQESNWYWASAGKTLMATLIGKAQEEGFLSIEDSSSDYLGNGWTSLTEEQEDNIKIIHQLTMSTGLEYAGVNSDCTDPDCLTYRAEPGDQWYYHNGPYTLLKDVLTSATGVDHNAYTQSMIGNKIGMGGLWVVTDINLYWSTARDMARFGLLILNDGEWDDNTIVSDKSYLNSMVNSSQELNPSYGYLWWLNGKSSIIYPTLPTSFNRELSPSAPDDLYAAMGKNGQFLDIIPSENMIVIRMGEAPDNALVPTVFHDEMWTYISDMMN